MTGNRVNAVRGITDKGEAIRDHARGVLEAEWIGRALAVERDRAKHAVHSFGDFCHEGMFRQSEHAGGILFRHRPDQRAAMFSIRAIEHGEKGEWAGGIEDFPCDVVVRLLVSQPDDDRAVLVVPMGQLQSGFVARGGAAPFGRDHQAAFQNLSVGQRGGHTVRVALPLHHAGGGMPGNQFFLGGGFVQHFAQDAVGEHHTQRPFVRLGFEVDPAWLHAVSYRDGGNRAAFAIQTLGEADVGEQVPAGRGNGRGAAVEAISCQRCGIGHIYDVTGNTLPCRSERQRHADKATTDDEQFARFRHVELPLRVQIACPKAEGMISARPLPHFAPVRLIFALAALLLSLMGGVIVHAQTPGARNHIAAELVANGAGNPGEAMELALHFRPEPGWHGYWSNPGDAGYGLTLKWDVPAGWQIGAPEYPVPHQLKIGPLMNHVYEGDYAVLMPVRVPGNAGAGPVDLQLKAEWLACTDTICVPERADLMVTVHPGAGLDDARFDGWRAAIPARLDQPARFALEPKTVRFAIPLPASMTISDPHVFVETIDVADYAAVQTFSRKGDWLIAELVRKGSVNPARIDGILRLGDGGDGIRFTAGAGAVPTGGTPFETAASGSLPSIWWLLGGALLGGLLLNIMPCVFPILSLKALSLARAGESESEARREGLAYTGGVMLACLALGGLLLALRAAGQQVGWAFQLQEPGVVIALLLLAVAITANLGGVFELPGLSLTRDGKPGGAFATGLLAAFVATPCTGPFMATAMGAALLLPVPQALLLFAALGLGLALPFLLIGLVPPLRAALPRPGAWMVTFRRILAVPMGLTALALLWLTSRLGGSAFLAVAVLAVVGLVLALWIAGRRQRAGKAALVPFVAVAAPFALFAVFALPFSYTAGGAKEAGLLAPQAFGEAALAEARASGKPVFVWFTADWCVTCKVNEGVAIEREATKAAFDRAGVVAIRGDWTRRDPAITRFLTAHGVAGVPLYLWYQPGGDVQQLSQVLTPDSLVTLAEQAPR